jgi:hypothetical protein
MAVKRSSADRYLGDPRVLGVVTDAIVPNHSKSEV